LSKNKSSHEQAERNRRKSDTGLGYGDLND
jgi:hypothetical protein